jgi:putative membrane protein
MNVAEVELGKMASGKATNPQVKEFADMMVKDHTDALNKLRAIPGAPATDVKPNAKQKQTADRLSRLSGAEFDQEYMKTMVTEHQEAAKFLEQQTRNRSNADLAKASQELLPTVRHHLQRAQEIQKELRSSSNPTSSNRK